MSNLGSQWKRFILSLSHPSSPDVVLMSEWAVHLLSSCPVSRPGVLEMVSKVVDDYMFAYTRCATSAIYAEQLYERGVEKSVLTVLCKIQSLVSTSTDEDVSRAQLQAPSSNSSGPGLIGYICGWCVNLLGQTSCKYAYMAGGLSQTNDEGATGGGGGGGSGGKGSLEDLLRWWLQCPVIRQLLVVAEVCLKSSSSGVEAMTALLTCSARYSPNLDWAMAHLGSRQPAGIFTRIVRCTLNDLSSLPFSQHHQVVSKFLSALSVLNHLGGQHAGQLKTALGQMITEALGDTPSIPVLPSEVGAYSSRNLVPFLLMVALGSGRQDGKNNEGTSNSEDQTIRCLVTEIIVGALDRYDPRRLMEYWHRQNFTQPEITSFLNMVTRLLITSSDTNSGRIIEYLIVHGSTSLSSKKGDASTPREPDTFQMACRYLLRRICTRLVRQLHSNQAGGENPDTLSSRNQMMEVGGEKMGRWQDAAFSSLDQPTNSFLVEHLLRPGDELSKPCAQLVLCRVLTQPTGLTFTRIFCGVVMNGCSKRALAYLFHMCNEVELWSSSALDSALLHTVSQFASVSLGQHRVALARLMKLVRYESMHYSMRPRLAMAISRRADALLHLIYLSPSLQVMHHVIDLFESAVSLAEFRPALHQSLSCTQSLCSALSLLINQSQPSRFILDLVRRCFSILCRLSAAYPLVRSTALKILVQEVAHQPKPVTSKPVVENVSHTLLLHSPPTSAGVGLLLPRKRSARTLLNVGHSWRRNTLSGARLVPPVAEKWCQGQLWLQVIQGVMQTRPAFEDRGGMCAKEVVSEAMQDLLVNGAASLIRLEHSNPQVDQVLQLYKRFQEQPVLWSLLELVCSQDTSSSISPSCTGLIHSLLLALHLAWTSSNTHRLAQPFHTASQDTSLPLTLALDDSVLHHVNRTKESRVDIRSCEYRDTVFLFTLLRKSRALPVKLTHSLDCLLPHLSPHEMHILLAECRRFLLLPSTPQPPPDTNNGQTNQNGGGTSLPVPNNEVIWELVGALLHNHIRESTLAEIYADFVRDRSVA